MSPEHDHSLAIMGSLPDFGAPAIVSPDARRKAFETVRAECMYAYEAALLESTDDHDRPVYIVVKDELCKRFSSLDDVRAWVVRRSTGQRGEGV